MFLFCCTFLRLWYCLATSIIYTCNSLPRLLSFWLENNLRLLIVFLVCLCALVKNAVKVNTCVSVGVHVCVLPSIVLSVCGSSASSVWAMVITVLHCICRSQWSWTHCLSLHGSQQLCEFPGDIAVTTKPASCIFYQSQCVSVCCLSLFLSVCAADSRCVCVYVFIISSSHSQG